MFRKTLLVLSLAAAVSSGTTPVYADAYYVVVPIKNPKVEGPVIDVNLNAVQLPSGVVLEPYVGFDFNSALTVRGDSKYDQSRVIWAVSSGSLPEGLTLNADGTLTGTPSIAATSNFDVHAAYKDISGGQTYQLFAAYFEAELSAETIPVVSVGSTLDFEAVLENQGNAALKLEAPTLTGAAFTLADTTCSNSLAPSSRCTFQIQFSPVAIGAHAGSLGVETRAGLKEIEFSGQGVASDLRLTVPATYVGAAQIGSSVLSDTITLANQGGAPAEGLAVALNNPLFTLEENSCTSSLAAQASCTFKVRFTPDNTGAQRSTLTVQSTASTATAVISAAGREVSASVSAPGSKITWSYPGTRDFNITVLNSGSGPLKLTDMRLSPVNNYFARVPEKDTCKDELSGGSSCNYVVRAFAPKQGTTAKARAVVTTDVGELASGIFSSGVNQTILEFTPKSVNFGEVIVGESAVSSPITIKNVGNSGGSTYTLPPGVSLYESTCPASGNSFPLNSSCSVRLKFEPTNAGTLKTQAVWTASTLPYVLSLSGAATLPTAPRASNFDFGWVDVGYAENGVVTLINPTANAIATSSRELSGNSEFTLVPGGSCGASLAKNSSCTIAVSFKPEARGLRSPAQLKIPGFNEAAVSGKGAIAQLTLTPAMTDLGEQALGYGDSSVIQSVTLRNTGDPTTHLSSSIPTLQGYFVSSACASQLTEAMPSCDIKINSRPDELIPKGSYYESTYSFKAGQSNTVTGTVRITPVYPTGTLTVLGKISAVVGNSTKATVTLTNTGAKRVLLENPKLSGNTAEFFISMSESTCSSALQAKASCTYQVAFMPQSPGEREPAQLSVSIGAGQVLSVDLEGQGL